MSKTSTYTSRSRTPKPSSEVFVHTFRPPSQEHVNVLKEHDINPKTEGEREEEFFDALDHFPEEKGKPHHQNA